MQVTMRNPRTTDVKVIPAELEDVYTGRGWEKTSETSRPAKKTAARRPRKTAAAKPPTESDPPTQ